MYIQVAIGAAYGNRTDLGISTIYNSISLIGQEIQCRAATRAGLMAQAQTARPAIYGCLTVLQWVQNFVIHNLLQLLD